MTQEAEHTGCPDCSSAYLHCEAGLVRRRDDRIVEFRKWSCAGCGWQSPRIYLKAGKDTSMKQFIIKPVKTKSLTKYKLSLVNKGKLLFELPRLFQRASDAERMAAAINPAYSVKRV